MASDFNESGDIGESSGFGKSSFSKTSSFSNNLGFSNSNGSNDFGKLLTEGAAAFGVSLDRAQVGLFRRYMELLEEWNQKFNLTAIKGVEDTIIKHFLDSLSIVPHIPREAENLMDVGTGAGFPGIPVKIALPALDVSLTDSLKKRVDFLREAIVSLGLEKTEAFWGRAEDLGKESSHREFFSVCTARAVASLNVLAEYALPFVKVGGLFLAMKGSSVSGEIEEAGKALDILGGRIEEVKELVLPFSEIKRCIIIIKKFRQTPSNFPRKAGKPSKQPLI